MSRPLRAFWIVAYVALIGAVLWAAVLAFQVVTSIYILRGAKGYRAATFYVEALHYNSGGMDQFGGASYWASGLVLPGNHLERLSLLDFFETPPENLADVEAVLRKGDQIRVLFNPDMTDTMLQNTTPRVLLDTGDVWSQRRSNLAVMVAWALVPLLVAAVMVWLARRWANSGPLITWSTRTRRV